MIQIYHNPRCQKSRTALEYIESTGEKIEVIEYLKTPPTVKELTAVLALLKVKPLDIVRKKEALYIEKYKDKSFTDAQWIKILVENPILIERPILVSGKKAAIARDAESLENFI
ncbi:MAG: arsenate reductase (glutaredoxin) [Cytophaga sp.]|uniref:arsenate reductase (glutaredoxin) n=1 Tax=Cytophaga sp. TaxID=29535 RepID=UPI003F7E1B08